jgi:hypothetical protein
MRMGDLAYDSALRSFVVQQSASVGVADIRPTVVQLDLEAGSTNVPVQQQVGQADASVTVTAQAKWRDGALESSAQVPGADCPAGTQYGGGRCSPCAPGFFSDVHGLLNCKACNSISSHDFWPRGSFSNTSGASACYVCDNPDTFVAENECKPCDPDQYLRPCERRSPAVLAAHCCRLTRGPPLQRRLKAPGAQIARHAPTAPPCSASPAAALLRRTGTRASVRAGTLAGWSAGVRVLRVTQFCVPRGVSLARRCEAAGSGEL